MQTEDMLQHLSVDKWVGSAELAEALGINIRAVGQRMAALYRAGLVLRSGDTPYAYRRVAAATADATSSELTVVDDEPVDPQPAPPASFAIWDDGSLSVHKGDASVALDIDDVKRLITFVTRFR